MKTRINFIKYTSNGNNFVIVDDIKGDELSEKEIYDFAKTATDINFGIGCDNLIILQEFSKDNLHKINSFRNYWTTVPPIENAKYIFRMIEPDGKEALSCGNGLLCIANYLYKKYEICGSTIVTEIPTRAPKVLKLGFELHSGTTFVTMGPASSIAEDFLKLPLNSQILDEVYRIMDLKILFRAGDLKSVSNDCEISINGYLVFTGEPHLVLFVDSAFSVNCFENYFFIASDVNDKKEKNRERRASFGTWLVNHIGYYLNHKCRDIFPFGINVNFTRILDSKNCILEYRTYERGINHETLSCGTGAIAIAHVSKKLSLITSSEITLIPFTCVKYDKKAKVILKKTNEEWTLLGRPKYLLKGEFLDGNV